MGKSAERSQPKKRPDAEATRKFVEDLRQTFRKIQKRHGPPR